MEDYWGTSATGAGAASGDVAVEHAAPAPAATVAPAADDDIDMIE
jgi:hypothetical protein